MKQKWMFFWNFSCFFYDSTDVGNLISGFSAFSKSSLSIWEFSVHILLKPAAAAKSLQSYPTLCDPIDSSPPGSPGKYWSRLPFPSPMHESEKWKSLSRLRLLAIPWTSLENSEHYFASMGNECNCAVIWTFFGTALLWDWNENWPFPVLQPAENTAEFSKPAGILSAVL